MHSAHVAKMADVCWFYHEAQTELVHGGISLFFFDTNVNDVAREIGTLSRIHLLPAHHCKTWANFNEDDCYSNSCYLHCLEMP